MEKEIISSGKMTFNFIWRFIAYGLLLTLIKGFICSFFINSGIIITNIVMLILSGISIFIATKLSVKDIFNKYELEAENKKKYKRNIIIFFILIILITTIYYAFVYTIDVIKIDTMVENMTIADGQDITGVIDIAKNILLGITCISAVTESLVYIGMIKYQDKYIKEKTKKEDSKKGE